MQARKGAPLPHKPLAALRWCRSVGRSVGGKGVSGAREDLIQDSCVKGFGRNAFIRDIALPPPLLSLSLLSSPRCSCVRSHPFERSSLHRGCCCGGFRGRAPSLSFLSRARFHKVHSWPYSLLLFIYITR